MQYVYILQSKEDNDLYIGCTNDIKSRLILHNKKKLVRPYTKFDYKFSAWASKM